MRFFFFFSFLLLPKRQNKIKQKRRKASPAAVSQDSVFFRFIARAFFIVFVRFCVWLITSSHHHIIIINTSNKTNTNEEVIGFSIFLYVLRKKDDCLDAFPFSLVAIGLSKDRQSEVRLTRFQKVSK